MVPRPCGFPQSCNAFYDLVSEDTWLYFFYNFPVTQINPSSVMETTTKTVGSQANEMNTKGLPRFYPYNSISSNSILMYQCLEVQVEMRITHRSSTNDSQIGFLFMEMNIPFIYTPR